MRATRMSLTGTVIFGLLAGLSVGAMAQDEDEDETPTATYVTGKILEVLGGGGA